MYDSQIVLVTKTATVNAYGAAVEAVTQRDTVFCDVNSVGYRETYEAAAVGRKPEIKVTLPDVLEYNGQRFCEYDGIEYEIIRSYKTNRHELELTLERVH